MMQPPGDPLSTDDVRLMMEHRLAWQGNPNIKIGEIEEADDNRITAEIVTQDGSLVQKLEIDRKTGFMRQVE
ncbi:hypothetical protein [Fodinicurvata fenggangensis]|uniref:hypothetical protein n=1 Tax=Fodinicurvata fenggangensis TaxID=1121830 RepID=UPI00047C2281|nr:hypothetical protein [Fodinicurvata fenggangensis]